MAVDNKKAALEAAMKNIKKKFGDGAVMRLGENSSLKVDSISTGSLTLDIATGIGGLPRGRIIEIYGPESSGKTPLHFIVSLRLKSLAVTPHLLMQSTHLTLFMPLIWV